MLIRNCIVAPIKQNTTIYLKYHLWFNFTFVIFILFNCPNLLGFLKAEVKKTNKKNICRINQLANY